MSLPDQVLTWMQQKGKVQPREVEQAFKVSDRTVNRIFNDLTTKGAVRKIGSGRGVFYEVVVEVTKTVGDSQPIAPPGRVHGVTVPVGSEGQLSPSVETPSTQTPNLDVLRAGDQILRENLNWSTYAAISRMFNIGAFLQTLGIKQLLAKRWVIGLLVLLGAWAIFDYLWLPLRPLLAQQSELSRTKEELAQTKQLLAASQGAFREQLARVQNELAGTKAQLVNLQQQLSSSGTGGHLTMDQIVALTQKGASNQEIIDRIKASHYVYGLTADDLRWLRQHGVSEDVIQAMQETNTASQTTSNSSSQVQSQVVNKVWGWVQNKINGW